jgi:hypothetical protein
MLYPSMSPNGKRVHLSDKEGRPVCGSKVWAGHRVCGRVTCATCEKKRGREARRHRRKPVIVGLNWEPFYRELGRALERGEVPAPRVKVKYWPVLAE